MEEACTADGAETSGAAGGTSGSGDGLSFTVPSWRTVAGAGEGDLGGRLRGGAALRGAAGTGMAGDRTGGEGADSGERLAASLDSK